MTIFDNYPQGYWETNDRKFINKYEALLYATESKTGVKYNFFNDVWENFDRSLLGSISLQELYRQRAQQLRDKYDYLILYFSGGADSYNILRTFIDNNIRLDEVCVKWATDTHKDGIYTPNTINATATNYLSEWDYAIRPVLDEISSTHPEIKIEIVNWFENKILLGTEETFNTVNHWHDIEVPSLAVWSPNEEKLVSKGMSVGSIYGVDKPMVVYRQEKAYMYFPDSTVCMGTPNPCNIYGTEYFYWAKDLPLLTFEMAYQAILSINQDPILSEIKFTTDNVGNVAYWNASYQIQQIKLRHILYDNWTDKFQTSKPKIPDRSDKHFWLANHPELSSFKDSFYDLLKLHTSQLREDMCYTKGNSIGYRLIPTKIFFVV